MPSSYTFPNGQTLSSSALAPADISQTIQALVVQIFGINPATDPLAYSKVRIGWILQPAFSITDDVCSIFVTERSDPYSKIRDLSISPGATGFVTQTFSYTRVWDVIFTLYGPNSFDHARLIKSALLIDWTHDTLAASNLYLLTELAETRRIPEFFQSQPFERCDLTIALNEAVTETVSIDTLLSAEVIVDSSRGVEADVTIT